MIPPAPRTRRARGQAAVGDMQLAAVLGAAAVVATAALFLTSSRDTPGIDAVAQARMVEQAVHSERATSGTSGRYAALTTAEVAALAVPGGALPQAWRAGTGFKGAYGQGMTVQGCDTASCRGVDAAVAQLRFVIRQQGVPLGDCRDLVAADMGPDLRAVYVGDGTAYPRPMAVAQAEAACAASANTVSWVFR